MRRASSLLLCLSGCLPTAPAPVASAEVVGGFWHVALEADGVTRCIGLPFYVPQRDTAAEAIRDCRELWR